MESAGLVVFLLLLLRAAISAGSDDSIIHVPSYLSPGLGSWLSPSGQFAFGFYDTPNGYAVCIFLVAASERTVVWMANNFGPILPDYVFLLSIVQDGVYLWQDRDGIIDVYNHIASPNQPIESASMLDNGNFVLYNSAGAVIWQSFDYPTHALLPGQRLPPDGELFSRASQTDLDVGMFRLKMLADNDQLVQYPVGAPDTDQNAYFIFNARGSVVGNLSLNLDSDGRLYLLDQNSNSFDIATGSGGAGTTIYLATVDPDGIFRLYNRSMDDEASYWKIVWSSTEDKCVPKGICGVNSICSSRDQIVACTCLPGYRGSSSAGCIQDDYNVNVGDCRIKNTSVKYDIAVVENVIWDDNYYAVDVAHREEDCYRACVDDCECVVALFGFQLCHKQRTPLRYGRMLASDSGTAALVKVTGPIEAPAPAPAPNGFRKGIAGKGIRLKYVIIGVSIGIAVLLLLSIIICYLSKQTRFCGQDEENKQSVNKLVLSHGSLAPKRYSYKQIKKFTKSFAEKLGQGGYGIVYKGQLPDGQLVAVKVLTKTHDNAEEFVNEVASISRTSHVNIVNLLGFCYGRKKRALVYEFMPKTSLDKFISSDAECSLDWKKLYEIAVGVARGLEYLHGGCNTRIVHFDIKPQNILLDRDLCPKISDFGLAKLCMKRQSVISMLGTRGTIGYIAPEVFSRNFGLVSHKSDVYSYGIMLLQMVEARANVEVKSVDQWSESFFLERIYKQVLVRNEKVVYGVMREEEEEGVRRMLMVGFWCIQTAPADRPSMNKVVDMLQGNVQCIQIPPLPFLLSSPKPQLSCLFPGFVETQKVLLEASCC